MKLGDLLKNATPHKRKKRTGRGSGSGHGKTSGRGTKGTGARSGAGLRPGFEGGQMPLIRRIPKRGFTNIFKKKYQIVNLSTLKHFKKDSTVDVSLLKKSGIIKSLKVPVKILGEGGLDKPLIVKAHAFSDGAKKKIKDAGGKVEIALGVR